jgi:leader peptidase (prepilin peptidase)/N-methyltransferase
MAYEANALANFFGSFALYGRVRRQPFVRTVAAMSMPPVVQKHALSGITALLFGLALWRLGVSPELPAVLAFIFGGVLLAVIDWKYHLLPKKYVYRTLAAVSAGLVFAAVVTQDWLALITATLGGVILAHVFFAIYALGAKFLHMKIIGFGDVRLALILGVLLGWYGLPYLITGMVAALFVAFPFAAVKLWQTRKFAVNMAFGPPLLLGTLIVILAHA